MQCIPSCLQAAILLCRRVERNADGSFFQIFQHNKWKIRMEKEAKEKSVAMAMC